MGGDDASANVDDCALDLVAGANKPHNVSAHEGSAIVELLQAGPLTKDYAKLTNRRCLHRTMPVRRCWHLEGVFVAILEFVATRKRLGTPACFTR